MSGPPSIFEWWNEASDPERMRRFLQLFDFVEDVAGMDCISYTKHAQEHPCGVCVSCRARAAVKVSDTP